MKWIVIVGFDAERGTVNLSHPAGLIPLAPDEWSNDDKRQILDNDITTLTIGLLTATKSGQDLELLSQKQTLEKAVDYFKNNILVSVDKAVKSDNGAVYVGGYYEDRETWVIQAHYSEENTQPFCNFKHPVGQIKGDFPLLSKNEKTRIVENDINTLCMALFAAAQLGQEMGTLDRDKTLEHIIEVISQNLPRVSVGGNTKAEYETIIKPQKDGKSN